jgi:hypothetical protein
MTRPFARATLVVLLACALPEVLLAQGPTDIGALPGYTITRPRNINNGGDVVGQAERPGVEPTQQAALWTRVGDGYDIEALSALPGLVRSDARAFARGYAPVGSSSLFGTGFSLSRAVVWRNDPSGVRVPVDLEPPPGFTDAQAFDANHFGTIVGEATNPREIVGGLPLRHAVAWVPKGDGDYDVLDLEIPEGFDVSSASGVNEVGEIVGTARRLEPDGTVQAVVVVWRRPFLHQGRCHGETIVLPSHPDLPRNMNPVINTVGFVVAQGDRVMPGEAVVSRPLLWKRWGRGFAGPYELPVPLGFTDASPADVNELGAIVGTAFVRQATPPSNVRSNAVVWARWWRGKYVTSVLPNPQGVVFATGARINERGDAIGNAPIPAPGTSGGLLWKRATCTKGASPDRRLDPRLQPADLPRR